MRLIKMFGLAAIAAVAAMAFIGASSASATFDTVLCSVDEGVLTCAEKNWVTHIHAVSKKPLLLSSLVNVHCEESLVLLEVLKELAKAPNPLIAHLKELRWINCLTEGGSACEVKTLKLGLFLILKTAKNLANAQSHDTEVNVHCGFFINCTYGGLPTLHALGAELPTHPGRLTANKLVLESTGGGFCPSTSEWDATYEPLTDVYIKS